MVFPNSHHSSEVSLSNCVRNVLLFFSHHPSGGVEADGNIRYLSLYNRRGSPIWEELGWVDLPGVNPAFFNKVIEKTGKHYHEIGIAELKKLFTPYEIVRFIDDPDMSKILGVGNQDEIESLKGLSWKQLK